MILIISHKTDFTCDYLINKLNERNLPYKRFNCEDLLKNNASINIKSNFELSILNENKFKSIWFRRTKLPIIEIDNPYEREYITSETDALLKNIFSTIEGNWFSHPDFVYKAENKLFQLKEAIKIGFNVPKTLVTNSKKELIDFAKNNHYSIIIKPFSQTRIAYPNNTNFIFTNLINKEILDKVVDYDLAPAIYQEYIEKEYELRVTVVGEEVFAAGVYSQSDSETMIDWRRKRLDFVKMKIPEKISQMCINLTKQLGLKFGAIDLIKTKNNEYYFLEINPNGQWVWIESQTGLKISEAIIKYLYNDHN